MLTRDVIFPQKSYSEYTKVEKPAVLTTSYEESDEEEELKTVSVVNSNNNINVVSNSDSESSEEDVKSNEDNFLTKTSMIK